MTTAHLHAGIGEDVVVVAPGGVGHVHGRARQELGDEGRAQPQAARAAERLQHRHPVLHVWRVCCSASGAAGHDELSTLHPPAE